MSNLINSMKPGRICIVLAGRQAGKKCVIVNNLDKGTSKKKFPHALVAGVAKAPMKVTKKMGKKRIAKRCAVKPFVKNINYNHILPTRYTVSDFDLTALTSDAMKDEEARGTAKKEIKKAFETQYMTGNKGAEKAPAAFFFKKLRF